MKLNELHIRLNSLAIFRALLRDPVVSALLDYLNSREKATSDAVLFCQFKGTVHCTLCI